MLEDPPSKWFAGASSPTSLTSFSSATAHQMNWNAEFSEFIKNKTVDGVNIEGKKSPYIPFHHLDTYWAEDDLMQESLKHVGPNPTNPSTIRDAYVRIWSTLVSIGRPQFIDWFIKNDYTDERLPDKLILIADDYLVNEMLGDFDQARWKFMPLLFHKGNKMQGKSLDDRHVLPITFEDCLTPPEDGGKTIIWKARIHDHGSDFEERTVVLKIYEQHPRYLAAFKREWKLLANLPSEASEVIVNYLGSFKQNRKSVIVLEFAPGGNLAAFLRNARTPATQAEFYSFWTSLASLLIAVYYLNNLPNGAGCAHRDIKFENILVFPGSTGSSYDFTLKLTDFDTISDVQEVSSRNGSRQLDDGGRVYCAPEASRLHEREQYILEHIPLNSDIWSLGALFSDIIVWLAEGFAGIDRYEEMRKVETNGISGIPGSGYENCFHNGLERLKCVDKAHERSLGLLAKIDDITPRMKELTESFMLVPSSDRPEPKTLHRYFTLDIQRQLRQAAAQDGLRPANISRLRATSSDPPRVTSNLPRLQTTNLDSEQDRPQTAGAATNGSTAIPGNMLAVSSAAHISNNPSPVTTGTRKSEDSIYRLPEITVEDANAWLASKTRYPIQGMEEVLQDIKDRDQLFVIDDSKSMAQYKAHLYPTMKALLAFACQIDPDRVEIVFTSDPKKVIRDRLFRGGPEYLARKVLDHFDNGTSGSRLTNMESKLGDILLQLIPVTGMKKTSVYVMTDAVWQPSSDPGGGVEITLRNLIGRLKNNGQDRDFVTLQFIRFGDDPEGLKRLKYLDDELAKEPGMDGFDIVDYRERNDNVPHMLMGAYSRHYDGQDGHVDPKHKGLTTPQEVPTLGRRISLILERRVSPQRARNSPWSRSDSGNERVSNRGFLSQGSVAFTAARTIGKHSCGGPHCVLRWYQYTPTGIQKIKHGTVSSGSGIEQCGRTSKFLAAAKDGGGYAQEYRDNITFNSYRVQSTITH
ncbi:serine/threonine protein kinase [Apiospora marii]|uniref:serine/threonine protein kinase n=1 Tax=Apiospora marii TaxID=335849 RepID=UPI00312F9D88